MIVGVIWLTCFSDWSFAVDDGSTSTLLSVAELWNFIVSILSWIWVIFAKLAWEFLTNKWVYGEWLGIDALLWQYRNIVKNMANFCLWFYLLYVIFDGLIWQYKWNGKIAENLKSALLWVLIAWVWIQASWFLTGLIIDLSTVTISAVWAFPSQIISQNKNVEESIISNMREYFDDTGTEVVFLKIHDLFPEDGAANSFTKTTQLSLNGTLTKEKFFDNLMPNKNDVAGPLYYLWFSILRVNEINSISSWNKNSSVKKTILNLIVQWWATIVYAIEIGILCVIALMRILYLWMFVVLSPFAVLLTCLQKASKGWGGKKIIEGWFIGDLMKQINFKTFLAKVFQPAFIVLWISLATIFVSLIGGIVNKDPTKSMKDFDMWNVKITTIGENNDAVNSDDNTYTTKIEWNLLEFSMSSLWKWFLELIMCIITVVLVYFIIKTAIKIWDQMLGVKWDDFLSKRIGKVVDWVEKVITSVPVVPIAWYDKEWVPTTHGLSIGQVFGVWSKKWDSLIAHWIRRVEWKIMDKYREQNQVISWWFNDNEDIWYLNASEQRIIEQKIGDKNTLWWNRLKNTLKEIKSIRDKEDNKDWKWMTLNGLSDSSKFWRRNFENWLTQMVDDNQKVVGSENDPGWNSMITWWKDHKENRSLENMFKSTIGSSAVSAYAKFFFDADDERSQISDWTHLQNADISKKKSEEKSE